MDIASLIVSIISVLLSILAVAMVGSIRRKLKKQAIDRGNLALWDRLIEDLADNRAPTSVARNDLDKLLDKIETHYCPIWKWIPSETRKKVGEIRKLATRASKGGEIKEELRVLKELCFMQERI